jgi:transcriptional regulator with PAS, ATPase and Fis domain
LADPGGLPAETSRAPEPVVKDRKTIDSLLGTSQAMEEIRSFIRKAARVRAPVLILGETGTGKSLLGRVIHNEGQRADSPYLSVNCAGVPDTLFESEFFGHRRGAFTGAEKGRRGLLEQAHGGSLFLDEVGELTIPQQAKLLTAIEEGEVRRLGGEGSVRVDVRVLAATARDLPAEMITGRFRRDLFHRLAVLTCLIPPLRERREDISVLVRRFLRELRVRHGGFRGGISPDALAFLETLPWHGNVRELSHLLEAAVILSEGRDLDLHLLKSAHGISGARLGPAPGNSPRTRCHPEGEWGQDGIPGPVSPERGGGGRRYAFQGTQEEEREVIKEVLLRVRGNRTLAARELGMARNTLRKKIRILKLEGGGEGSG